MSDVQLSNDPDAYWAIRVTSADTGIGYIGEVDHELAIIYEITDSAIEPIEGAG